MNLLSCYRNKRAVTRLGKKSWFHLLCLAFRDMLKKGQSVHWKQQLSELTGDHVNSKLALQYYAPLERWLDNYLEEHDVKVGWDKDGD